MPFQDGDLARLCRRWTRARRARFAESHLVVVSCGGDIAAVVAYKPIRDNVCAVHEFAFVRNLARERRRIVDVAMDAIETACVANGRHTLVVLRTDIAPAVFKRRGYAVVFERCAGAWLQKDLSSARAGQFPRRGRP
jgi:hypothetical protein